MHSEGMDAEIHTVLSAGYERMPLLSVPARDVPGGLPSRRREVATDDKVALVNRERIHIGICADLAIGNEWLPFSSVPTRDVVDGLAASLGEISAGDQLAVVDGKSSHASVVDAGSRGLPSLTLSHC